MEKLWQAYHKALRSFILSRVNNTHDAEDLLQDVFLKVYLKQNGFKGDSSAKTWLYSIARNTVIDYYRKKKDVLVTSEKLVELADEKGNVELENDNCNTEVSSYLKKISHDIPKIYQEVFELREQKYMKHKDIATKLGISVSTSKIRHMRAKIMLKDNLTNVCHLENDKYGNITDCNMKDHDAKICC